MIPDWLQPLVVKLPARQRAQLRRIVQPAYLGALRRTQPLSNRYGFDRGTPVDRYYIEKFLSAHASDIQGRALEVKNADYLRRYGRGVSQMDILDIDASNAEATVVADLATADHLPDSQFDAFVLTQTLQLIYDWNSALRHAHRILRPGGVLLVTVPSVSRVDRTLAEIDLWRFTPAACRRMFAEVFGPDSVTVTFYGNVLTATAFLMGMAAEDLRQEELDRADPSFPVLVAVRAQRAV
jgi:SAM-dependent methyltransferase